MTRRPPPPTSWPVVLWLSAGLLAPVGVFFVYGFWEAGVFTIERTWSLARYQEVFWDPLYRGLLLRTLGLAWVVSVVVVPAAYASAYALTFSVRRGGRRPILFLIVASALASYLVRIYAWKAILSPNGVANWVLVNGGLRDGPAPLLGRFGVTVTLAHILIPVAVLPIVGALGAIDADVFKAARDLGAGPVRTFVRVTLPLSARGVMAAFLLVFVLAAGDYVTPQLVGGRGSLMVGRVIYDQFGITGNFPLASALSFALVTLTAALFAALWLVGKAARFSIPGRLPQLPLVVPPWLHSPAWLQRVPFGGVYLTALLIFLYFPLLLVVVLSFNQLPIASFPITGLTLRWYREALGDLVVRDALVTSLQVGAVVSLLSLAIGLPAAFALSRHRFAGRSLLTVLTVLPVSLPGVVIGFSILSMFRYLHLSTSLGSVVLGQVTLGIPFVVLIAGAALHNFDRRLEDAARDLGCSARGALQRVTIPILLPSLIGAALLVFAVSMDEFVVTNFLIGSRPTLPPVIWSIMNRRGIPPTVNAIASLLMLVTLTLVAVVAWILSRTGRGRAVQWVDSPERGMQTTP